MAADRATRASVAMPNQTPLPRCEQAGGYRQLSTPNQTPRTVPNRPPLPGKLMPNPTPSPCLIRPPLNR